MRAALLRLTRRRWVVVVVRALCPREGAVQLLVVALRGGVDSADEGPDVRCLRYFVLAWKEQSVVVAEVMRSKDDE